MLNNDTREKIKSIVRGFVIEEQGDTCTAIRNLLCTSFSTSTTVKEDFESKSVIKEEQVEFLTRFCDQHQWWVKQLPDEGRYLTRGGEAKVYLDDDNKSVIKLNDAVYYATWLEYFNSVVLHNLIFKDTAYSLMGFTNKNGVFQVVLKQPFIISDSPVNLEDIRKILTFNGFENTRRNDYFHKELGLILEDMHDENVIARSESLFFIDTVFYTVSEGSKQ